MLEKSKYNVSRVSLEKEMNECGVKPDKNTLDFLFGDYTNEYDSEYVIKRKWIDKPKTTVINRINCLWVYPIFIILAPFRYVLLGEHTINKDSTLGKVVLKLIGEF